MGILPTWRYKTGVTQNTVYKNVTTLPTIISLPCHSCHQLTSPVAEQKCNKIDTLQEFKNIVQILQECPKFKSYFHNWVSLVIWYVNHPTIYEQAQWMNKTPKKCGETDKSQKCRRNIILSLWISFYNSLGFKWLRLLYCITTDLHIDEGILIVIKPFQWEENMQWRIMASF